jgi:hypothetical protein
MLLRHSLVCREGAEVQSLMEFTSPVIRPTYRPLGAGDWNRKLISFSEVLSCQMRVRLASHAMNEGTRWKKRLRSKQGRSQLEKIRLAPWTSRRRQDLLELLDRMNPTIAELTAAAEQEAKKRPEVLRLPIGGFVFEPSRLCRHPSIRTLLVERFSLGASWAFPFQQVLLPDSR